MKRIFKGRSRTTHQTQTIQEQTTRKARVRNKLAPYLIAVICLTSFYSFEFLPNFSDRYNSALTEYNLAEKKNKAALKIVKDNAKGTVAGDAYAATYAVALEKWNTFKMAKKDERVFAFKSLQLFLGEFGPMFCFFVYAMFMLVRSFKFDKENIALKILHGLIISGTIFYFLWMFEMSDFPRIIYYLMTLISATIVVWMVWLVKRFTESKVSKLEQQRKEIAKFVYLHTKPEAREKMLDLLEKNLK
ncbi:hypothetical protein [Lutibacter sp. Hel_I_33_5]|uniref:hypothetical protein n=1 Tax=Lutibacter sp. Hel_I_33_5 TaxID=1566289 RepID=UPI0011A10579|nr:hypothetical protein [Lutibacter sp. Hel_I_33_5]